VRGYAPGFHTPVVGTQGVIRSLLRVPHPPVLARQRARFLAAEASTVVLQPIVTVAGGELVAAEALTRFTSATVPPDETIADAHAAGRGGMLEAACLAAAFAARDRVPAGVLLSVNVSPAALLHPSVRAVLDIDLTGIIIEITEQPLLDPVASDEALAELRRRGALLAVDDAAAGYAGLKRVAAIRPDIVKLDRSLITGCRHSLEQISVIDAMVSLSHRLGCLVLGEGVETFDDLAMLAELDIDYAQGRAIAAPAPQLAPIPSAVVEACRATRIELLRADTPLALAPRGVALHRLSSALAGSAVPSDLDAALDTAASSLGVDRISLSVLTDRMTLRELRASNAALDAGVYHLPDYPATQFAIETGSLIEAHRDDEQTDPAERRLLASLGLASLLLVPLYAHGRPIGIMEFSQRTTRRWAVRDITVARMLGDHVAQALARLEPQLNS
jgi:EAL domain-containing protein (putative c-di-GMP-specific phosphodiesterase class I)